MILSWKNCMQIGLQLSRKKLRNGRETWKKKGHGEYREISEGGFLGEVTGSEKVICHFYHKEFYRCKMHHSLLQNWLSRLCLVSYLLFRQGVAIDRLVGFQDLGGKDDFSTRILEALLIKKGIIAEKKDEDDKDNEYPDSTRRVVRFSTIAGSDSD
ncbi:thioredoxin domain-containing protein PLP3B-like [Cajanus cajan]|uniref:thioredoxin domain-containing protein PLP3B-like n=1 Tax=Cajanus cajan TaxID=3821 RepID=UPI0010FAFDBE|nr:thioredoxin domain-containing protein PLP3B-like [Cajanus cajan]